MRLDSGDLLELSRSVRRVLDDAGLPEVTIFASGNLDEREIARLLGHGAPIDGFGVGSRPGVSADAPYLDAAYKLVALDGRPVLKLSSEKATLPGAKQVWRRREGGRFAGDVIALVDEPAPPGAEPLLATVMAHGSSASSSSKGASSTRASAGQSAATPRAARSVSRRSERSSARPASVSWCLARKRRRHILMRKRTVCARRV